MGNPRVSVVITGLEAKYYDEMLDLITLFQYERFMRNLLLTHTRVFRGDSVAELGLGNGRNARILVEKIGMEGEFVGFEISHDMIEKARKKLKDYDNVRIVKHDVREDFPEEFHSRFKATIIVLAFHGFTPVDRGRIMENVARILVPGGRFYIFDYNQMDLSRAPWYFRLLIDKFECPLAEEFLSYDLEGEAMKRGFRITNKIEVVKNLFQYVELTLVGSSSYD